ncbi:MAG: 4Fe-4S dicluster domain-containing protein [Planctomycetota bacterium]
MIDKLKTRVKELLETKTIGVFIGYEKGDSPELNGALAKRDHEHPKGRSELARPVMITSPDEADKLIYDDTCCVMLSKYLLKPEVKALGRRGVIASYSSLRAITALIQEHQLTRNDVYIIATSTSDKTTNLYDELIEMPVKGYTSDDLNKKIAELMKLSPAERRAFWDKEFNKCIKCYACRQICPMCYCNRCIADKNQPQWIPTSPNPAGNFMWNLTRAYHLAGRCVDCGECERACPVGIPLMLLNKMVYNNIKANFGYEAGFDDKVPPPLATYSPEDKENFII